MSVISEDIFRCTGASFNRLFSIRDDEDAYDRAIVTL